MLNASVIQFHLSHTYILLFFGLVIYTDVHISGDLSKNSVIVNDFAAVVYA